MVRFYLFIFFGMSERKCRVCRRRSMRKHAISSLANFLFPPSIYMSVFYFVEKV